MLSTLQRSLREKHLLLCFDAFGTLFKPRTSISAAYAKCARHYGVDDIDEEALATSFRRAFKNVSKGFPNYGKATGMKPDVWWAEVIRESFKPVTSTYISNDMIHHLMKQFSSNQAYRLFDDVLPFFDFLKATRGKHRTQGTVLTWPWKSTTVGIVTNSDPRVPNIFRSFGLSVRQDKTEEQRRQQDLSDISFVTMSYNVGFEKPHVQIFQAAEMAFAELPFASQISNADVVKVHVGDDMEQDTFGAMDSGWNAIFLDREERFRNEWLMAGAEKPILSITEKGTEVTVIKDLGVLSFWSQELTN